MDQTTHSLIPSPLGFGHCYMYSLAVAGLRFHTNQSPPLSLLAAGDAQEEEDDAEGESYEMRGSMGSHSRESHFGRGWRWTTTV